MLLIVVDRGVPRRVGLGRGHMGRRGLQGRGRDDGCCLVRREGHQGGPQGGEGGERGVLTATRTAHGLTHDAGLEQRMELISWLIRSRV